MPDPDTELSSTSEQGLESPAAPADPALVSQRRLVIGICMTIVAIATWLAGDWVGAGDLLDCTGTETGALRPPTRSGCESVAMRPRYAPVVAM